MFGVILFAQLDHAVNQKNYVLTEFFFYVFISDGSVFKGIVQNKAGEINIFLPIIASVPREPILLIERSSS